MLHPSLLLLVGVLAIHPGPTASATQKAPLLGDAIDRTTFRNAYGHIPAQCYIETSGGRQNACQFCHTNGAWEAGLGNNNPQAGGSPVLGNLQEEYAFAALHYPHAPNGSINPWENTLFPERLLAAVRRLGQDPESWDMAAYVREDNWTPAFAQRPGSPWDWDPGVQTPFRLFPGLDPGDLPADAGGFVRSVRPENGLFQTEGGWITGWRAVNFMPYGIFTPHTGSVSGIYIRLPRPFMVDVQGALDLDTYSANLDLLARAIQDRLEDTSPKTYLGGATNVPVERGLYPRGTEFAHPLHYVDLAADGRDPSAGRFPGTRARRVKEVRWMYKIRGFEPNYTGPGTKEEDAPAYANRDQGWIENGAGWLLASFIEDARGQLRPQTPAELVQCVGCHSGNGPQDDLAYDSFTSGTGNTIDSTWAFPRQLPGASGWAEMDYLGYRHDADAGPDDTPGSAAWGDPINRRERKGELRYFLDNVVGLSLYGVMPPSVDRFLARRIHGWPTPDTDSSAAFLQSQSRRQTLLRQLTASRGHLDSNGKLQGALLYPTRREAADGARRYRQVVVTQRYDLGKDVFPTTPPTFRYFRPEGADYAHQDGRPYEEGVVVVDRPVDTDSRNITYGVGTAATLIDPSLPFADGGTANPGYLPLLRFDVP
jgi:mono/diheme cytochrome c family protein